MPSTNAPSDCSQPGCDRRALAGATLCGPHLKDESEGRSVIWRGRGPLPIEASAVPAAEETVVPKRKKARRRGWLSLLNELTERVNSLPPSLPAVNAMQANAMQANAMQANAMQANASACPGDLGSRLAGASRSASIE
jgi:hypothetical protein